MISSIVSKELKSFDSYINILLSKPEDRMFFNYLKTVFNNNCCIFGFESTYYGNTEPNIIICNNRLTDMTKSIEAAKFFHCGLLIVDTDVKPDMVVNKISNDFNIHPVIQIALSYGIHNSWNKIHNYILDIDQSSIPKWQNTIYNICKEKFIIKNHDAIPAGGS